MNGALSGRSGASHWTFAPAQCSMLHSARRTPRQTPTHVSFHSRPNGRHYTSRPPLLLLPALDAASFSHPSPGAPAFDRMRYLTRLLPTLLASKSEFSETAQQKAAARHSQQLLLLVSLY